MKKTIKNCMLLALFLLMVFTTTTQAQSHKTSNPRYKDMVMENPNAEADMKVVSDYVNSLVAENLVTAKAKLAKNYMGYGPSSADSATSEQTIKSWQENYKRQTNRKVSFVTESFRVKSGALKGNWVSLWGDYSFTENGIDIKFPFQYTAKVNNEKIETDRIYFDNLYITKQLGYTLSPPAKK